MSLGYLLLAIILGGVAVYTVIPDLFLHRLGIGSWKRQYTPGVAITFDDGPDPDITPRILEILSRHQVRAVFFVVAEKAKRCPELIHQIQKEGHQIGIHSLNHRYAWFTSPRQTLKEWTESLRSLESVTGHKVTWMRPPWGTFNLMTWWWLKSNKMRAVLWNVEGHDWVGERTAEEITQRILKRTDEGTIVLMHDSARENVAHENSVLALEQLCDRIVNDLKLPLVSLEFPAWPLGKRLLFRVWEKWEHYYAHSHHVERVDARNIFRLEKSIYEGPELFSEDGKLLACKGDLVAEIHLDNIRLQAQARDMRKTALKVMRQARESLPGLAQYIINNSAYDNIKVFMGQTLIYRGVKGFGFSVQDLPDTWKSRGIVLLQKIIMRIYHPEGKEHNTQRLGNKARLVWISREKLLGSRGK